MITQKQDTALKFLDLACKTAEEMLTKSNGSYEGAKALFVEQSNNYVRSHPNTAKDHQEFTIPFMSYIIDALSAGFSTALIKRDYMEQLIKQECACVAEKSKSAHHRSNGKRAPHEFC